MAESVYHDLLVELECPICTNYMSPPIRQCATGHSICESCRQRLPACALCQGSFTESRNISLEGLAVKLRYPCVNKSSGCNLSLAYNEREFHELNCSFKGVKCAMEKCGWVGPPEQIAAHWASKKITSKPYKSSNVCHTKLKSESFYVNIIDAYDQFFWFKCKLTKKRIFWAVQHIGKDTDVDKFYYEIEVFKAGRTKRKILLSDYCQSIDLENADLFKEGACISITTDNIEPFVGEGQEVLYYMRVHQLKQPPSQNVTPKETAQEKTPVKQRDRSKGPQGKKELKAKKNVQAKKADGKAKEDFVVV